MAAKTQPKNKPVFDFKIWPVKGAVWRNENDNGVFYNVTVERSYKDGDEYKSTGSFQRDDLLPLAKVADVCHTWIIRQEEKDRQASSGTE